MDPRFSSVRSDGDPRFPKMLVAKVASKRDIAAFPIGATVVHEGETMRVVGRDENAGTLRMLPKPGAPPAPTGIVHYAEGFDTDDGESRCGRASVRVSESAAVVECVPCLDAAIADAEAVLAELTARRDALKGAG